MKKIVFSLFPIVITACLFGSSNLIDPDAWVAEVDGRTVVFARLDSVATEIKLNSDLGISSDSLKAEALDSLIAAELIETRIDSAMGTLDRELEFRQKKRDNIIDRCNKLLYQKQVSDRVSIDSAMVESYYEEHKSEFVEPEQVKARHILIRRLDPDTAGIESPDEKKRRVEEMDQYAKDRAEYVLERALEDQDWDSLAAEFSEDQKNASKGGSLGYVYRGRMSAEFDSVVFSTPVGEIVGPISTKQGYHVIRVDDYIPERQKALDDELRGNIRSQIRQNLEKEYATTYLDSLKEAASYEFNEEALTAEDSLPPDTWVLVASAMDTIFYNRYSEALPRYLRFKQIENPTMDDKKELLRNLATSLLLFNAARNLGYLDDPEIIDASREFSHREAKRRITNMLKDPEYQPSDEEVEAYYSAHIDDYRYERPLLVYHIIFEDSLFAETIRDSILAGAQFVEMARRYYPGEPEIREVAYNLDYIGPDDMGRAFYDAADTLSIGEISHPVKTNWGYHIIKLISRKEDKTLKQVRPGIKHKLRQSRDSEVRSGFIEKWKAASEIRVNEKLLREYSPPGSDIKRIEPQSGRAGG
jgi:parvulin-like peptidyl-prolyl isomerase